MLRMSSSTDKDVAICCAAASMFDANWFNANFSGLFKCSILRSKRMLPPALPELYNIDSITLQMEAFHLK